MKIGFRAGACLLGSALLACTMLPARRGAPPAFSSAEVEPAAGDPFPNWPLEPLEIESLIRTRSFRLTRVVPTAGGLTGADVVSLYFPSRDRNVDFKWKLMPPPAWSDFLPFVPGKLDGVNNSPRKELAAWEIQKLFLDPEDYVVPTTMAFCAELSQIEEIDDDLRPTLEGTRCELGVLATWLRDVTVPDRLLDPERFRRDPVYAHHLANFNLLTYLIEHHDGRPGNFLVSRDDDRRQVFSIDNGVAFSGIFYNWFVPNWCDIRVPALRKASIDRLRALGEADLARELGVLVELRLDEEGVFHAVDPGPNLDEGEGVRYRDGVLQLGLTDDEIEDVWERIEDLIEDVDEDDIAVF